MKTTISIPKDAPHLLQLFKAEQATFKHQRASYSILKKGKGVEITITAEDAVALRATVNSVLRVIALYEKAKNI